MGDTPRVGTDTRTLRLAALLLLALPTLAPAPARASESDSQAVGNVHGFAPLIALAPGDEGAAVARLQTALKAEGFYRGEVTGTYDTPTASAVITFHKYVGIDRTASLNSLDWIRIALLPKPDIPYRWDEPDRVEIDTTRQLLFVIRDHRITGILPTSTGSGGTYYSVRNKRNVTAATPHGDFELRWRQYGWNCDPITNWCVYNYWAFTTYYGIHGYRNVPAYPASHGCTRVHTWDSDWLDDQLYIGMPVHIWRDKPIVPPPPPKPLFERV